MIRRRPFWLPVRAASIQLEAAYPSLACWLEPGPALQLPLLALQLDRGRRMETRTRVGKGERCTLSRSVVRRGLLPTEVRCYERRGPCSPPNRRRASSTTHLISTQMALSL